MLRVFALVTCVLTLPGCFGHTAAASICQPRPNAALLCVYRNQWLGPAASDVDLLIDGQSVGTLEGNQWIEIAVVPGRHVVSARRKLEFFSGFGPASSRRLSSLEVGAVGAVKVRLVFGEQELEARPISAARGDISSDCSSNRSVNLAGEPAPAEQQPGGEQSADERGHR